MYYVSVYVYFTVYFLMYSTLETLSLFKLCFINKDKDKEERWCSFIESVTFLGNQLVSACDHYSI